MRKVAKLPNLKPKEKTIEKYLREQVKKAGGRAYKFVSPAHRSVPDRIVLFPNAQIYFVEVKTPTGRVTPLQQKELDYLQAIGHDYFVVRSKEDIDLFLSLVDYDWK